MRRADNLTTFVCRLSWNLGASTCWNPQGLYGPIMGLLYPYLVWIPPTNTNNYFSFLLNIAREIILKYFYNFLLYCILIHHSYNYPYVLKMISDDLLHQRWGSPGFCDVKLHRWVCAARCFETSCRFLLLKDKGDIFPKLGKQLTQWHRLIPEGQNS